MTRVGLSFEALGYRDAQGRITRRTEVLEQERRAMMRRAGRTMTGALKDEAPKREGLFAAGIYYRTYDRGHTSEVRFYVRGEHAFLLPMIVGGTKPHVIRPRGDYPLRFYWEKGPSGPGEYRFMHVNHPGTQPNAFPERAYQRVGPDIIRDGQRVAVKVARV